MQAGSCGPRFGHALLMYLGTQAGTIQMVHVLLVVLVGSLSSHGHRVVCLLLLMLMLLMLLMVVVLLMHVCSSVWHGSTFLPPCFDRWLDH